MSWRRARSGHDINGLPLKANAGAVIVMDAQTGAIEAMASLPSYDPRWLVQGLTKSQASYLYKSAAAPSLNRAIQLGYVPGSTFKPMHRARGVEGRVRHARRLLPVRRDVHAIPATRREPSSTTGRPRTSAR